MVHAIYYQHKKVLTRFWSGRKDMWPARPRPGGWRRWRMAACSSPSWPGSQAVCPCRGRSSGQNGTAPSPRVRAQHVAKTLHKKRRSFLWPYERFEIESSDRERKNWRLKPSLQISCIWQHVGPASGPGKSVLMSTPLSLAAPLTRPVPEHSPSVARSQPSGLRLGIREMSVLSTRRVIRGSWSQRALVWGNEGVRYKIFINNKSNGKSSNYSK